MKWSRVLYVVLILVVLAFLYSVFVLRTEASKVVDISTIAELASQGNIDSILVDQDELSVKLKDSTELASHKESDIGVIETLRLLGVSENQLLKINVTVASEGAWGGWLTLFGALLPLVLIGGFFFFILRQAQGAGNQALSFGKSRARLFTADKPTVTFDDVAGVEEAKQELAEIVEFLREPEKFVSLGARIPKGVLMVGPPGCGKTLTAKAIAGEAGVPFFSISGSEFVEMFVGVGASRARDLFDQAKRNSPCIIFIDEIDAVGRQRGAGLGSHDEREQTLNQILVEMDGFDTATNVIVVAATNRPDILDPALLRPGRFDRRVVLDRPDWRGREKILNIHVKGKPLAKNVDLGILARQTSGFVGADLENMVNEAAILAARRQQKQIFMEDFQNAVEKVIAGPERKSRIIRDKERQVIAHHEAGHALVRRLLPACNPVYKVSIITRGMTHGYVIAQPKDDRFLENQSRFEAELAAILGGRAAEEIIFEQVTTNASDDLHKATKLARAMVTQYGMSELLGPLIFGEKDEMVFLGKEIGEHRNYSEEVARQIDREVRRIIETAHGKALQLLGENKLKLKAIAERLLQDETLDSPTFEAIFAAS